MELQNIYGDVIFALESAKTVLQLVKAAIEARKSLYGADLRDADLRDADLYGADLYGANLYSANLYGADLYGADLRDANLYGADLRGADLRGADLRDADLYGADLRDADLYGADLRGADLRGADLRGKKISKARIYSGLYRYEVWAILFEDGSRMVRMGCLWKSLDEWEAVGIRKSNLSEFPDDGSDASEERVRAFEFAKDAVLRLK